LNSIMLVATRALVAPKPVSKPRAPEKVPRVVRLLALAHHFQKLLDDGWVSDYADIARLAGVSRARVSQIMDLLLLAPSIQEAMLLDHKALPREILSSEKAVFRLSRVPEWKEQVKGLRGIAAAPFLYLWVRIASQPKLFSVSRRKGSCP